jgi:hypothetical protein
MLFFVYYPVYIGARNILYLTVAITLFIILYINIQNHWKYKFRDIFTVSTPFLVFFWILTIIINIGAGVYGGLNIMNTLTMFSLTAIVLIISFYYMTRKKFV